VAGRATFLTLYNFLPFQPRSLTSWILPMENGWPELACRMLEKEKRLAKGSPTLA